MGVRTDAWDVDIGTSGWSARWRGPLELHYSFAVKFPEPNQFERRFVHLQLNPSDEERRHAEASRNQLKQS